MSDFSKSMTNDTTRPEQPDLLETVSALKNVVDGKSTALLFYGLSNRTEEEFYELRPYWDNLPADSRYQIILRMIEVSEMDFEMEYRTLGLYSLNDTDPRVRESAIELLWEDESSALQIHLEELAKYDPDDRVKARALRDLGRFILLGELGNLREEAMQSAQLVSIEALTDSRLPAFVRRRALEAISNSSHELVEKSIRDAYYGDEHEMRIGSIFAMGRTCDTQWNEIVLEELNADDHEIRFEAARASGELEIKAAIRSLARLTTEPDLEIKEMSIWALGEIGGSEAMRILDALAKSAEETDDEELLEAIEEAMGSASLAGGDLPFMLDLDEDEWLDQETGNS